MLRAASRMRYGAATLPAAMEMRRLRGASNNAGETKKKKKKASPILALLLCFFLLFMKKRIATESHTTRQRVQGMGYMSGYGLLP